MKGYVLRIKKVFRVDLMQHPQDSFVFEDNMQHNGGYGGAGEMRGEPNAVGIPTKWTRYRIPSAYFRDHDLNSKEVTKALHDAFDELAETILVGYNVVWPYNQLGTGPAMLNETAPKFFNKLSLRFADLVAFSEHLAIVADTVPNAYTAPELKDQEDGRREPVVGDASR